MRRIYVLCLSVALIAWAQMGCGEKKAAPTEPVADSTSVDSTVVGNDTLVVKRYVAERKDTTGEYAVKIAWPVDDERCAALTNAIREWENEMLGGTFKGDAKKPQAMADHYLKSIVKRNHEDYQMAEYPAGSDMSYFESYTIFKDYEAAKFVTFSFMGEMYSGGAHGGVAAFSQTFRKSDGRRIGWDVFNEGEELQKLMRKGLIDYFSDGTGRRITEEELADELQGEATQYHIPMPQCPPIFQKDGVCFLYNQYEIAAYAAGMPQFVIPYKKLKPLMKTTAQQLIE
ncbi:MAG: DUF3298 domain-containing protein [Prevotella sp.]|nr:DUF3298 domain-containing protein [Prevotella sp.]